MRDGLIDLTIIIPHYNTPHLLEKLINTIPDEKVQIIVVDDNSDKHLDKLQEVQKKYSKKVEFYKNNTMNKGAGTCRNIGMKNANGKWILFADSDDYFLDDFYEKVSVFFDTEYDVIYFAPTSVDLDTGEKTHRHEVYSSRIRNYIEEPSMNNLLVLTSSPSSAPWSKLIKRSLIEKNNIYFSEVLFSNDIMFSAQVGYYGRNVKVTLEPIYCVTRSKGTLTTNISVEAFDIRLEEYIKVCLFLKKHYSKEEFKCLHATGAGMLYKAVELHLGIKKYLSIIYKFYKSGIPIVCLNTLTPNYWIDQIKIRKAIRDKDKKYYIK